MKTFLILPAAAGLSLGLLSGAAVAEDNHFLGQWHWSKARSTLIGDEPVPQDVRANIENADNGAIRWTAEVVDHNGNRHSETFSGKPDGNFYPVQGARDGVSAAFTWNGGTLQSVFKHRDGISDTQSCHVDANNKTMVCNGTWTDGKGTQETFVDVYERI